MATRTPRTRCSIPNERGGQILGDRQEALREDCDCEFGRRGQRLFGRCYRSSLAFCRRNFEKL